MKELGLFARHQLNIHKKNVLKSLTQKSYNIRTMRTVLLKSPLQESPVDSVTTTATLSAGPAEHALQSLR